MQTGTVKWFNNTKGYGFILPDNGGSDIFAHYSAIDMDGYKTLKAGQNVQFEAETGPKGLHACKIQAVGQELEAQQVEGQQADGEQVARQQIQENDLDTLQTADLDNFQITTEA